MGKTIFTELDGSPSATRVNTNLAVWIGFAIIIWTVIAPVTGIVIDTSTNLTAAFTLIGAGFTAKIVQKPMEKK